MPRAEADLVAEVDASNMDVIAGRPDADGTPGVRATVCALWGPTGPDPLAVDELSELRADVNEAGGRQ